MSARVVAISHTTGSGGESIGRIVSERLAFRYVDEEIVAWAAEKAGVEPNLVADAERRKGLLGRFVDGLGKAGVDAGGIGLSVALPDPSTSEDFQALIGEAIRETAERGEVVIVAHAASIALAGRGDLVRILVTASPAARAQRLADAGQVDGGKGRSQEGRVARTERQAVNQMAEAPDPKCMPDRQPRFPGMLRLTRSDTIRPSGRGDRAGCSRERPQPPLLSKSRIGVAGRGLPPPVTRPLTVPFP